MVEAVRSRASILIPLLLVIGAIIASFLASSGPIQWMDNGMFLADATEGQYFSQTLGPLDHPLYLFFTTALYAGFGSHVLSLMNSLLLIPLAWAIYRLARGVGATAQTALLSAAAAILCHCVFWISTKAEVYLLHTLLVTLAYMVHFDAKSRLGALQKLFLIGLLTGLAAAIHQLTFIVLFPLYVQLLWQHRARTLMTLPGFLLGFAVAFPGIVNEMRGGLGLIDIGHRYLIGIPDKTTEQSWQGALFRFDDMWHEKNSVVLLVLFILLRAVIAPLVLVGVTVLSAVAALGLAHRRGQPVGVEPRQHLVEVAALAGPPAGGERATAYIEADRDPVAVLRDHLRAPLRLLEGRRADVDPSAAGGQRSRERLVVADAAAHLDLDVEGADDLRLELAVGAAAEGCIEIHQVQPLGAGVLPAHRGGDRRHADLRHRRQRLRRPRLQRRPADSAVSALRQRRDAEEHLGLSILVPPPPRLSRAGEGVSGRMASSE